ncbi:MAG: Rpn family recombination-promoting nuclease/putative transposase [Bacteroidales bacterium]|nr:Rpn family recombination-promoting nuclease/putative transposase [Bacteroidales bacterium]
MVSQIYNERQRYIIPTSDWGFKRLFGSEINKGLLISLLNKIIDDRVIEDLEYLDRDVLVPVGSVRRMSFDVYCKCTDGSRVIVEMQNYAKTAFVERALVYTSASILENYTYSKSRDYRVQKTYLIAITGEKIFPKVKHAPVRLALCDMDAEKTSVLNDKILHIFIELPKFADKLEDLKEDSSFLSKFAVAMKTMASYDERPSVMDDDMLVRMFDAADLHTYKSNDKHNYKKAVMNEFEYEETLKEYRQEGLEEGREEGRKEGREEGRETSRREIASKMLKQGIPIETISQCTGLEKEDIASL